MKLHKAYSNIKSAALSNKIYCIVNYSKFLIKFLDILYINGFIAGYKIISSTKLKVYINYFSNSIAIFSSLKIFSKASKKNYIDLYKLLFNYSGKFCIISTSKGLLTGTEALKYKIGGELIRVRYYF